MFQDGGFLEFIIDSWRFGNVT